MKKYAYKVVVWGEGYKSPDVFNVVSSSVEGACGEACACFRDEVSSFDALRITSVDELFEVSEPRGGERWT